MAGANQSEPLSFGEAAGGLAEQARPASDWFKKKKKKKKKKKNKKKNNKKNKKKKKTMVSMRYKGPTVYRK